LFRRPGFSGNGYRFATVDGKNFITIFYPYRKYETNAISKMPRRGVAFYFEKRGRPDPLVFLLYRAINIDEPVKSPINDEAVQSSKNKARKS
jgi:hypothetical protein